MGLFLCRYVAALEGDVGRGGLDLEGIERKVWRSRGKGAADGP